MAKSQFLGFDELAKKLSTLTSDEEIGKALSQAVRAALAEVVKDARSRIPVGTEAHRTYKGRLVAPGYARRSIRTLVRKDKTNHKVTGLVGVRAEAYYALQFVELGTSKMAAQPWLRPAFEASKDPAISQIGKGMRSWIEEKAAAKFARALNPRVRVRAGRDARLGQALLGGLET